MKKDSYYFSHDYNARNDFKCLFLRQQLGMEGYGIYWFLIESLAESGGLLPLKIVPVLAMQMQVTETKVTGVINSFDLFEVTDNEFFSIRLNKHLEIRSTLSESGKKGAIARWNNSHPNSNANSHPISDPNAKERKERKERKENSKVFTPPILEDVLSYFKDNGYSEISAQKAFRYYNDANWMDSKGNKVKNWKQKMQGVWFKDENKQIEKSITPKMVY